MALSISGSKSSRKLASNSESSSQPSSQPSLPTKSATKSTRTPVMSVKAKSRAATASESAVPTGDLPPTLTPSNVSDQPDAATRSPKARSTAAAAQAADGAKGATAESPVKSAREAVQAVVKAVQEVASKASARSRSASPARKTVRTTGESRPLAGVQADQAEAMSPPATSKATTKVKSKKAAADILPVPAPALSPTARRNREREALNLYTTAMEAFKQSDYDRARDVLQLLLSHYMLESEVADRARVFLKICEQKLQSPAL